MDPMIERLIDVLVTIEDGELMHAFLTDLCTRKELEQMAQRLTAARLLKDGLTYQQVMQQTGIATTTLSRVSQALQYGEGYQRVLEDDVARDA